MQNKEQNTRFVTYDTLEREDRERIEIGEREERERGERCSVFTRNVTAISLSI